jgi:transforming growth factor-beta-induced protein
MDAPSVAMSEATVEDVARLSTITSDMITTIVVNDFDLIDTALADGRFTVLLTAIEAAGLEETLRGPGPYTLFAPTDDAFGALPPGTLDALMQDPAALTALLDYHLLNGQWMLVDVSGIPSTDTILGMPIAVTLVDGALVLNGTTHLLASDIRTRNGVIHVIDTVLLPPVT